MSLLSDIYVLFTIFARKRKPGSLKKSVTNAVLILAKKRKRKRKERPVYTSIIPNSIVDHSASLFTKKSEIKVQKNHYTEIKEYASGLRPLPLNLISKTL